MSTITVPEFFKRPRAGIDYIRLRQSEPLMRDFAKWHRDNAIQGKLTWPENPRDDWIQIHDPTPADLQLVLDRHRRAEVIGLEFYLDFFPKSGNAMNQALLDQLGRAVYPQRGMASRLTAIKAYDPVSGKVQKERLTKAPGLKTRYLRSRTGYEQVRVYLKEKDQKRPVPERVRLEITFTAGGCQLVNAHRMVLLPSFIKRMRKVLARYLYFAKGIKPKLPRLRAKSPARRKQAEHQAQRERLRVERAWSLYGTHWAIKHAYGVVPDRAMNELIQAALKDLRERLLVVKVTGKPAEVAEDQEWALSLYDTAPTARKMAAL